MINIWYVPFVVPAELCSGDAFRRSWHLTGTHVPVLYLQSQHKPQLCLHTEASGGQVRDWHFSSRGTEWHEREALYFLTGCWWRCCVSVRPHCEIQPNLKCLCMLVQGRGRGAPLCARRGPASSETAPGRLDFQLHDEAFVRRDRWLCKTAARSRATRRG